MSQIQPADCAVEMVCEAIGLASLSYGTCTASARVAEQHVAALLERHAERLADEQRLEAGAIDEQIAFDLARLLGVEAADVAVLREVDAPHVGEHVAHAELLAAMPLQERRELARRRGDRRSWRRASNSAVAMVLGASPSSQIRPCGQTASQKLRPPSRASQCGTRFTCAKLCGSISG